MNRNPKLRQYTNEPYFSFENFMFSNLTRVTTEEKNCRICERKTNGAYFYRDKTYYAHFECLSTYFLYQFFEITDPTPPPNPEDEAATNGAGAPKPKKQISLSTLYDISMEDEVGNGPEEDVCYSCGIGDVYFKCLVENCPRHIHMECAGNGSVIVYTSPLSNLNLFTMLRNKQVNGTALSEEAAKGDLERERVMEAYLAKNIVNVKDKQVSYRFLVCYKHANPAVVNEIKLQFLAKMVQVAEYQHIHAMVSVLKSFGATQSAGAPYAKPKEEVKKEEKKTRGYFFKSHANLAPNYTYQSRSKAPERADAAAGPDALAKREENRRNVLLINNLVYEYNQYKKTNIQKIVKPLTAGNFMVLFQPMTSVEEQPDAPEGDQSPDAQGAGRERDETSIEHDIRALMSARGASAVTHVNELKKMYATTEHTVQNIVGIIRQLLWTAGSAQTAPASPREAEAAAEPGGNSPADSGREMLEREVYRVTSRKPKFVIMKLYNKFLWMAVMQLSRLSPELAVKQEPAEPGPAAEGAAAGPESAEAPRPAPKPDLKTVLLDYVQLTNVDYVYLRNLVNSVYNRNVLLMHHRQHKLNAKLAEAAAPAPPKPPSESQEAATAAPKDKQPERETISLCGYNWDINPPLYRMHKAPRAAGEAERAGPQAGASAAPRTEDNFVHRQAIALMSALSSINANIEHFKSKIEANIAKDAQKYKNLCFNPEYVRLFQNVANALLRFNHFKQSVRKSVLHFNNPALARRHSTPSVPSSLSGGTGSRRPSEHSEPYEAGPDELALDGQLADDEDEILQEKEAEEKIRKEYCSVCLLSEFSHKHVLLQCQKCYLRVHYKCYFNYALAPAGTAGAGAGLPLGGALKSVNTTSSASAAHAHVKREPKEPKDKDDKNMFFCDPCKIEYNNRYETTYNSAICIACQSSGGAMKSIFVVSSPAAAAQGKDPAEKEERWIHLMCLVFVMPRIVCHDINNLGRWHIVQNNLSYMNTCSICGAVGGIQVECCYAPPASPRPDAAGRGEGEPEDEDDGARCGIRFHPMCCLLSGCYVRYSSRNSTNMRATELKTSLAMFAQASPVNNPFTTSCMDPGAERPDRERENAEKFEALLSNLFQAIVLEPYCVKHTAEVCTEKWVPLTRRFLADQCTKRCHAYTHYLYNPDGFKSKKKYNALPLEPIYSPVTITRSGPIKSQPRILPQHYSKKFSYEIMAKRVKHNEPYLISVVYGLPKSMCGEGPKYGITAIANYLSIDRPKQKPAKDSAAAGGANGAAANHAGDGRPNHEDRQAFARPNHQPQLLPSN